MTPALDRLLAKTTQTPSGCWEFTGSRTCSRENQRRYKEMRAA